MTNTIPFNHHPRFEYHMFMPMVATIENTFSAETIDKYLLLVTQPFPVSAGFSGNLGALRGEVYFTFMEDIVARTANFLENCGEDTSVQFMIEDSPFGSGIIKFMASPKTVELFKNDTTTLFSDIQFTEELREKGASWSNIHIEKTRPSVVHINNVHKLD